MYRKARAPQLDEFGKPIVQSNNEKYLLYFTAGFVVLVLIFCMWWYYECIYKDQKKREDELDARMLKEAIEERKASGEIEIPYEIRFAKELAEEKEEHQ